VVESNDVQNKSGAENSPDTACRRQNDNGLPAVAPTARVATSHRELWRDGVGPRAKRSGAVYLVVK
jgi:hypothetical protein